MGKVKSERVRVEKRKFPKEYFGVGDLPKRRRRR